MKAKIIVSVLCLLGCTTLGWAQGAQMYDRSYAGPMNMYGQPTLTTPPQQQAPNAQNQVPMNGAIPLAARGVQAAGSYLWSYMPAPMRGVESPYKMEPGSGQVIVNFVPGSR
jgi:hypothetical protein